MRHATSKSVPTPRQAAELAIDEVLLVQARSLDVDISRAAAEGIAQAIADRRAERWLSENRAALDSSNAFVERQGLPLAGFRAF